MDKLLVIFASFGQGHKQAAGSVHDFFPSTCVDLLDFSYRWIRKVYMFLYLGATQKASFLWRAAFHSGKSQWFRRSINGLNRLFFSRMFSYLDAWPYSSIVVTHFFPIPLIAQYKKRRSLKLIVIVTDIGVHPWWVHQGVDHYCVASQHTKQALIKLGVAGQKISVGYVPVRRGFNQVRLTASVCRNSSHRPQVLFMASLSGLFPFGLQTLKQLLKQFTVHIVCSSNQRMLAAARTIQDENLKVYAFHDCLWSLMQQCSVVISKPGGLTVFEGMYLKKLFVFTHYIPGQEYENMQFLIGHGVARFAVTRNEFITAVQRMASIAHNKTVNYPLHVSHISYILPSLISPQPQPVYWEQGHQYEVC